MTRAAIILVSAVMIVIPDVANGRSDDRRPLPGPITAETRLGFDGLGPIRIGMTLSEARLAGGLRLPYSPSRASAGCGWARVGPKALGAALGVWNGIVLAIQLRRSPIRVRGGGRIGDTLTGLRRHYGARLRRDHPNPYVRTLTRGKRRIVFSVDEHSRVDVITVGERPAIDWSHLC